MNALNIPENLPPATTGPTYMVEVSYTIIDIVDPVSMAQLEIIGPFNQTLDFVKRLAHLQWKSWVSYEDSASIVIYELPEREEVYRISVRLPASNIPSTGDNHASPN